jgi:hypothetical protein
LKQGNRELWFAGGPGIGYALANKDAANAAVALEMGKLVDSLTPDRQEELMRTVQNGSLGDRVRVS